MKPTELQEAGIALLAVLFALTLLMLLALPFGASMSAGADAAMREVEAARATQLSASVRDLLLADASLSHPLFDETPTFDDLMEWPDSVHVPDGMKALLDDGRVTVGGSVEDLQRRIALDSISPLVLANLIGTAARLTEQLEPDATAMQLDSVDALPESGYVWLANELVFYGQKDGNRLVGLERGQFLDLGFSKPAETYDVQALVLDYRCVLAAAWPFMGRSGSVTTRKPYAEVTELAEVARAGMGAFTQDELDRFAAAIEASGSAHTAATWGRPERVFNGMAAGLSRVLRVKSALHVGPGSTVRLRSLASGAVEYGLVMTVSNERNPTDLILPSVFNLGLLMPVSQDFPAGDTTVEPLVPPPLNINTAAREVLQAVFEDVRRAADVFIHDPDARQRATPPRAWSRSEAATLADEVIALRAEQGGAPGQGPFTGWQDFVERIMKPRLEAASNREEKSRLMYFYRNLRTGRDSAIEMGTLPICFDSGPWVRIRAAASLKRSRVAPGVAARHERNVLAAAVPGYRLEHAWKTQRDFEEAFVLDRRAPYWTTTPINLGAVLPGDLGNDPSGRYFPHLLAIAFPELGFGAPRYAATDEVDAGVEPGTAMARLGNWRMQPVPMHAADSFAEAQSPHGHDLSRDGPFLMVNTGPSTPGGTPKGGSGRHDGISFPFSVGGGFMGRFATQFWLEPQTLEGVTVFDHSDGDPNRNRFALHGRDGNLVLELIDEAGLDPDPSQSPAGVERTANELVLPLAELGLPADTPVHCNLSAISGRPLGTSMHIDGKPRGKAKYVTYLTAPIDSFDPTLSNNQGVPGRPGNDRYIDIQVEDTEGFPPVGTIRIGTELFDYTSISGNSFQCQWNDSTGGRGARQVSREHRPDIPVDSEGKPTVDINDLQAQGINIDVFPEHPAGAKVELYGYSTAVAPDSPMMVGETGLAQAIGGWAVARAFLSSGKRAINLEPQGRPPIRIGEGIDETWTGDIDLADPLPLVDRKYPPDEARAEFADAFPQGGGYALLIQERLSWITDPALGVQDMEETGGIEVIKYSSRDGTKLKDVQRAQVVPGDDKHISSSLYDGTARKFVCDWVDWPWNVTVQDVWFDDLPGLILWIVPISLPVQSTQVLWDPQTTGLSEWVQLYPKGGDPSDTEWVRYDALMAGSNLMRGNRAAWRSIYNVLTAAKTQPQIQMGQLGSSGGSVRTVEPPWKAVEETKGYIGYVPKLESEFPQVYWARDALRFRGDTMRDFYEEGANKTSSHPQTNPVVTQCQRLDMSRWGNYSALSGRLGRHDRVALVAGSRASGTTRPDVEWHTVNWVSRRFDSDNLAANANPAERLGPFPFQLVAFTDGVRGQFMGPPLGQQYVDPRGIDRIVKFPSGELPAAYCDNVPIGSGVNNQSPATGFVDEVEVVAHTLDGLILSEACNASAQSFVAHDNLTLEPDGVRWWGINKADQYPTTGGLVMIDDEILAYKDRSDGQFTVATNGRGMLGTEARDHDRGAHVLFLTNRPAAILTANVQGRDEILPVQAMGALPERCGTVALGQELLHYSWVRIVGDQAQLEMPRWYPPGEHGTSSLARGLLRGRYGTTPGSGSSGEAVVQWPFRYWDRYAENSDDPELGYFQLTTTAAPSYFRTLTWREQVRDDTVDVVCLARTDSRAPWEADPVETPGLWRFTRNGDDENPRLLSAQGSRLEIRFATMYLPGCFDMVTMTAHGWKTTAHVSQVTVDYEGESRIFDERITLR
ncbi:MAG: hypothetical protein KDC98_03505 [Planctomycetes bacterium]|nr:hypothetical protein [Planctomycetota bacterium]